jgi:hypothetical protein
MGGDSLSSKFKKPLEVSVAAPDKEGLAEGLDHAKEIAEGADLGDSDESDEDRLMALLGEDDEDDHIK